jgi:CheY-like chemotaxis protein
MVSPGHTLGEPAREALVGIAARVHKPLLPTQVREVAVQVLGLTRTTPTPAVPTARALEVLVAEDDPVNRKLAVTLLRKHGHRVTVANDGREACAWLDRRAFDLVLMDMHMPDVDGFAATEAIRAHEAETGARRTPIVALTALATDEDRARCMAVGMDGHAHKPLRMAELMQTYGHLFDPATPVASPTPRSPHVDTPGEPLRAPAYDRAQLERNVDGDLGLMRELVDAFVVSHGEQVNALQSSLTERRVAEALRAAHSLKGMLLTLAATEAAQVAYDMELALRAHEVEHAVARMPELAVELDRLVLDLAGDDRRAA